MSQQPPQWQPTNPPVPQVRRSWFARHKVLSVVLGIVLVVVLICCGAGVLSVGGDDSSPSAGTESSQSSEAAQETDDATGTPAEEPTEETAEQTQEAAPEETEEPKEAAPEEPELTTEQQNAIRAAEDYLEFMPFSKQGLIGQLSSPAGDGYPQDVARFAVEHIESDVDWNEQAVKAAEGYLDMMAFSRSGLIDQLTSDAGDGYTQEQAEYAADQVGL